MKNIYSFLIIICCFAHINTYAQLITPYTFGSLRARELGPATSSGRVTALEALYLPSGDHPKEKDCVSM